MTDVFPPQPPPPPPSGAKANGAPAAGAADEKSADGTDKDGLPKRFGKYTLMRKLAQGGMAELFLALQKSMAGFEKLIVIKRILPSMNQDQAFIDMLLHEARVAATLSHPNIVQIFDVGQCDGLYYIAMEHVHGEDIRSIVRQMKKKGVSEFPLEHALQIILGMCAGLAYAHGRTDLDGTNLNIVHRDISPQNVVCTFSGDVKIVDFGIAKSDNKGQSSETRSGKLKGKVPYMSPEQARGEDIDSRSDIFATGVMLFELTTGKRLFKGQSEFETLKLICEREYPTPSQVRPGYPPELERIVMKALAKERADRYQTAREMQGDLEAFVRKEQIAVSTIALQQFMQTLFDDMLAAQKEALLQGKQLADIIASREPDPSMTNTGSVITTGSATLTLSGAEARKARAGWVVAAAVGLLAVAGGVGGFIYYKKHKTTIIQGSNTVANVPKGEVVVESDPPGASIWVNGDLQTDVTPTTIKSLPLGKALDIKLTKEGFESDKKSVTLTDKAMKGSVKIKLAKGSVAIDVTVKPDTAKPYLVLDGKKIDALTASELSSGEQHKLEVHADGYYPFTTSFISPPQEKKHFDVSLNKVVAGPINTGHVDTTPKGRGKLNVSASGGWCNVSVDGAPKGPTPIAGIDLASGPHTVTCTPEGGKAQTAQVTVPVDGTGRYKFNL